MNSILIVYFNNTVIFYYLKNNETFTDKRYCILSMYSIVTAIQNG